MVSKIECQIYALERQMRLGKVNNAYALHNKIMNLKLKLQEIKKAEQLNEFLSR